MHKKTVVACVLRSAPWGFGLVQKTQTFGTMTKDLTALRDWLVAEGVTHVAMEATGAYWKPVYNILEGQGLELLVGNAQHLKGVPGRKTDVKDAEWIATLLRHGLVRASFVPDRDQRELRELTRYRTALVRERAREVNRLQKTLESANIKLAAVVTDITGVSGQRILQALTADVHDPEELADLAHWKVQAKREDLKAAVVGRLTGPLRFVVEQQLAHLKHLDEQITVCDTAVEEAMRPFAAEVERLDGIPGVGRRTAEVIIAELGVDMSRFATAERLASWAGVCPGNRASGGKRQQAPIRKGNPWLKAALTEAAWAAGRCKTGYLAAQYHRLAKRRGRKRAIVAVAHSLVKIIFHVLADRTTYQDLGGNYFDERQRERVRRDAIQRLQRLGYEVTLTPKAA